jgi:hypothetical protein
MKCVVDHCSLYINDDECINGINEWCILSSNGCRTAESCGEYTETHMNLCDKVPGCTIFGGVCGPHPCAGHPPVDEYNSCPSGCMIEDINGIMKTSEMMETNINIIMNNSISDSTRNIKTQNLYYDIKAISKEKIKKTLEMGICEEKEIKKEQKWELSTHNKKQIIFRDLYESDISDVKHNFAGICVIEHCAIYGNTTCLEHTERKCVPTSQGCRLFFLFVCLFGYYLIIIDFIYKEFYFFVNVNF